MIILAGVIALVYQRVMDEYVRREVKAFKDFDWQNDESIPKLDLESLNLEKPEPPSEASVERVS